MKSRVRKAEKVISDLRSSGEDSVDQLMETLYLLKIQVEEREAEAEGMRTVIREKEDAIMLKEGEKGMLKQQIEVNNADRENEIQRLRQELDGQKELMEGQQKLMNELQVLCEFTQKDFIKANKDLSRKKTQKKQLNLAYQEVDQSTVTLKNKYGQLENQMTTLKQQASPAPKQQHGRAAAEDTGNQQDENQDLNAWGKPRSPSKKTRSFNAMFGAESGYDAMARQTYANELKSGTSQMQ